MPVINQNAFGSPACLNAVCRVSGFDALIDWKSSVCYRAVPDIMITFSMSLETATVFTQQLF